MVDNIEIVGKFMMFIIIDKSFEINLYFGYFWYFWYFCVYVRWGNIILFV